jgi:hypothetical protein
MPAIGLKEQRSELAHTLKERCEKAAEIAQGDTAIISWCHLNQEADLLERLIPGSKQVSGSQSDDEKEEILKAFQSGQLKKLVTKPRIAAWGLNFQVCNRMTFFPSHSFEQYYQSIRRCWRFGQTKPVTVDVITTEGQKDVLLNLQRKAKAAEVMFSSLVALMNDASHISRSNYQPERMAVPTWL